MQFLLMSEAPQTAKCIFLIKKKKAAVCTDLVSHVLKVPGGIKVGQPPPAPQNTLGCCTNLYMNLSPRWDFNHSRCLGRKQRLSREAPPGMWAVL